MKMTSIDRVFSKLARDTGEAFDEAEVIEWTGEALDAIGSVRMLEEALAFIEVTN